MAASPVGNDACDLSRRWTLDPDFAARLVKLDAILAEKFGPVGLGWPGLYVLSGFRSKSLQSEVNPSAPNSWHTRCPALAADLQVGTFPASQTPLEFWAVIGNLWKLNNLGGRWGGDFSTPSPFHLDLPQFP